ncbi:unnamed protein product [marine sediment metagenome]|uniref:Uncharacterized protein n=1 Tax=marine sediment metagenome TaxID=412755 RepID=X1R8D4_9ZZZZ
MNLFGQYIKAKKNKKLKKKCEKLKRKFFFKISQIMETEGCVSNLDLIELAKKYHFTKSTCTQYAKLYRNLNDLVAVLISHKQYLKLCTYKQFTKYHGKQHAYACHHSITIRREDLHLLLKSNTVKMAKDGTYYLCIAIKKETRVWFYYFFDFFDFFAI